VNRRVARSLTMGTISRRCPPPNLLASLEKTFNVVRPDPMPAAGTTCGAVRFGLRYRKAAFGVAALTARKTQSSVIVPRLRARRQGVSTNFSRNLSPSKSWVRLLTLELVHDQRHLRSANTRRHSRRRVGSDRRRSGSHWKVCLCREPWRQCLRIHNQPHLRRANTHRNNCGGDRTDIHSLPPRASTVACRHVA
jgi:hypothetical protein